MPPKIHKTSFFHHQNFQKCLRRRSSIFITKQHWSFTPLWKWELNEKITWKKSDFDLKFVRLFSNTFTKDLTTDLLEKVKEICEKYTWNVQLNGHLPLWKKITRYQKNFKSNSEQWRLKTANAKEPTCDESLE